MSAAPLNIGKTIESLILQTVGTDLTTLTQVSVSGVVANAIFLGANLVMIPQYYSYYNKTDPWVYRLFVGIGGIFELSQFGVLIYQLIGYIHLLADPNLYYQDKFSGFKRVQEFNWVIVALLNAFGGVYFSRRAWALLGRRRWIMLPGLLVLFASFFMEIWVAVNVGTMPDVKSLNDLGLLMIWWKRTGLLGVPWAALNCAMDTSVFLIMMIVFYKNKNEFDMADKSLLRRLVIITVESMIVPVILTIGILAIYIQKGVTMMHGESALLDCLGPSIYTSVLFSLISRKRLENAMNGSRTDRYRGQPSTDHRPGITITKHSYTNSDSSVVGPTKHEGTESFELNISPRRLSSTTRGYERMLEGGEIVPKEKPGEVAVVPVFESEAKAL